MDVSPETAKALTERIQDAGTEVVKAKVRYNLFKLPRVKLCAVSVTSLMYGRHHARLGAAAVLGHAASVWPSDWLLDLLASAATVGREDILA